MNKKVKLVILKLLVFPLIFISFQLAHSRDLSETQKKSSEDKEISDSDFYDTVVASTEEFNTNIKKFHQFSLSKNVSFSVKPSGKKNMGRLNLSF